MGDAKILPYHLPPLSLLLGHSTTGFVECASALPDMILSSFDSYTFNVINSILTRPVGGVLFGVAFWMVARALDDKRISDYLKLSARKFWNNVTFDLKSRRRIISSTLSPIWTPHHYIRRHFILFVVRWDILCFYFSFHEC